jgi:hypothetical protein
VDPGRTHPASSPPARGKNGCSRRCSTLARSEYGRLRREPVELSRATTLEPARTTGDPQLIQRLVANLVANAVRHNIRSGRLDVAIVQAIAIAHEATVTAHARTGGGLRIDVDFPAETWPNPLAA